MFSLGGNAGFALGPLLVTPAVLAFGLHGTLLALIPLWLARRAAARASCGGCGRSRPRRGRGSARTATGAASAMPGARSRGSASVIGLRSVVFFGLQAFIPVYFVHELGTSEAAGNAALSVMLVAGAVGTYVGGRLVDRIGRRVILVGSMAALAPLLVLFLLVGRWPATVLLVAHRLRGDRELLDHRRDGPGVPAEPARARLGDHARRRDRVRRAGRGGRSARWPTPRASTTTMWTIALDRRCRRCCSRSRCRRPTTTASCGPRNTKAPQKRGLPCRSWITTNYFVPGLLCLAWAA